MSNNGTKPIPFAPPAANIPIVGQPFAIEGWFITLVVTCRCTHTGVVTMAGVPGSAAGQCKKCGNVFILQGITINAQGQPEFTLAVGKQ